MVKQFSEIEIDAMEPGRALDTLVAARVLGHHVSPARAIYNYTYSNTTTVHEPSIGGRPLPSYSSNLQDTQEVLEKIMDLGYRFVIRPGFLKAQPRMYTVTFVSIDNNNVFFAEGPSIALAICRAALKIMEAIL